MLARERFDPFLRAERPAQRRRTLVAQKDLRKRFQAGPMVPDTTGEVGQDRDRARVAHSVRRRLFLSNRLEDRVGPSRTSFAGHERRPAAWCASALQRAGGVALGPAVADRHDAIPGREVRAVERDVEGLDRPNVETAAVLPQEMLDPRETRVLKRLRSAVRQGVGEREEV